MTDCIFCRIAAGEIPADLVYEDELVVGFRDLNPQAPTHVLLIPRKHIASINELQPGDEAIIGRLYSAAAKVAAQEGFAESGYRTVINCNDDGGQTVFHVHLHLLGGRRMSWPPG
jgi:histidine triad (HIT) family protein